MILILSLALFNGPRYYFLMSKILATQVLIPDKSADPEDWICELFSPPMKIGLVKKLKKIPEDLILENQKKMLRSMSPAAGYMAAVCNPIKPALDPFIKKNAFSVGIYCALENLSAYYEIAKVIANSPEELWAELYIDHVPPKSPLKAGLGVAPATIGIFLGALGPTSTFYDQKFGILHALDQAEHDLRNHRIQAALICTAHVLDDPLFTRKTIENLTDPSLVLKECGAAILLAHDGKTTKWEVELPDPPSFEYGISSPLIAFLQQEEVKNGPT